VTESYRSCSQVLINALTGKVAYITSCSIERKYGSGKMSFAICCSDLENLIVKPDKEKGSGLLWVINKRGTGFILEYRRDWKIPLADDAIQICFCPYCGRKLQLVT